MGATLRYAKVVDRDHVQAHGGLTPATDNLVTLPEDAPAVARDFLVLRAWDVDSGGFEETWRLEDVNGHVVYVGTPRTVLAEHGEVFDEVQGVRFEYADDAYNLVLEVDGREVARSAELDVDAVRSSLSRLTGPHDLVQEVGPAGETADQGPRYRVKARP